MARTKDRERALLLRGRGLSYSQIKNEIGVGKSTLSNWLQGMPLSEKRLRELRDNSQIRIEKTRETKRRKKEARRAEVYKQVSRDIEKSKDKKFIAGFYLYWGEGTKTADYTVSFTNSDPSMVLCFVEWLELLGVGKEQMRVKLHLYSDQKEEGLKKYWSKSTGISIKNFNKSYIKETRSDRKTYKGMFSHGTCVVAYHNRDIREYVMAGIEHLRSLYRIAEK